MITVYTKNNCGFCAMGKALLSNHGYQYTEINIEEDSDAMDFILSQGHRTMPQFYQNDEIFVEGGYSGLKQFLEESEVVDTAQLGDI
jgi:glutaredoxin-like protein NrdH